MKLGSIFALHFLNGVYHTNRRNSEFYLGTEMGNSRDRPLQLHSNSSLFSKSHSNSNSNSISFLKLHSNSTPTPACFSKSHSNSTPTPDKKTSTPELELPISAWEESGSPCYKGVWSATGRQRRNGKNNDST
jgi:hypothetical protein